MTFVTGFFQITHLGHWWKKTMGGMFAKDSHDKKDQGAVSQFQVLCTALAATKGYKVIFTIVIMAGAVMESSLAWDISDTFNGLMMIPNLIGVVTLFPLVGKITEDYIERKIHGKTDIEPMLSYDEKTQAEHAALVKEGAE